MFGIEAGQRIHFQKVNFVLLIGTKVNSSAVTAA
jgi:hypothetical protein